MKRLKFIASSLTYDDNLVYFSDMGGFVTYGCTGIEQTNNSK